MELVEIIIGVIGLWMLYSTGHFLVIQHSKVWKDRSVYEKVITVMGIICIVLWVLTIMFD